MMSRFRFGGCTYDVDEKGLMRVRTGPKSGALCFRSPQTAFMMSETSARVEVCEGLRFLDLRADLGPLVGGDLARGAEETLWRESLTLDDL